MDSDDVASVDPGLRRHDSFPVDEKQWRLLVEHIPASVAMFDRQMRYLAVSRRWMREYLPDVDDPLGRSHYELFPDCPQRWRIDHRRGLAGETVEVEEDSWQLPDGSVLWMRYSVKPWPADDGTVGGIIIVTEDITWRKRAEEGLRRSEARFRSVVANMSEGLMLFDAAGDLVYQNPASLRIHGFAPSEDGRLRHEELPAAWAAWDDTGRAVAFEDWPVSRVFRGERFQDQVLRVVRQDTGFEFHGSYNGSPILDADGRLALGFITIRDISEQVRAKAALQKSERRLRTFFDSEMMGAIYWNMDGRILDANDKFLRMVGYSRDDLRGGRIDWGRMTPPEYRDVDARALEELRDDRVDLPYEKEYIRRDGTRVPILIGAAMLDDLGDEGVAFVLDITERKRADEALRAANLKLRDADRRKDEFLATLAHELRNPLAPIRTGVQILRLAPGDRASAQVLPMMERQVAHMTRLLDDLLDVSRVTRGKIALRRERVGLDTVVQAAVEASRPLIDEFGHRLAVELPAEPAVLEADTVRLSQVFSNLLNNAAKYSPPGSSISLVGTVEGDRAIVRIKDNGDGIPPESQESIFDLFAQVPGHRQRVHGGLGIGLHLVRALLALHGGDVAVESEGAGKGSTFIVRLPLKPGEETARPDAASRVEVSRRVLVVDDNRDAAASLALLLKLMGHDVRVANDGESALAIGEAFRPSIVLLDLGMPGMDGVAACRRMRSQPWGGDATIVAVTGWGHDEDRRRTRAAGFDEHLVKPVSPEDLQKLTGG